MTHGLNFYIARIDPPNLTRKVVDTIIPNPVSCTQNKLQLHLDILKIVKTLLLSHDISVTSACVPHPSWHRGETILDI